MLTNKSYKFLLAALLAIGLTHQPTATAAELSQKQRILISAMVGAVHGLVNKIHFDAVKEKPRYIGSELLFYWFTYVLSRAAQCDLIGKNPHAKPDSVYTHNDFMTLLGHGLAQSLVESYDTQTEFPNGLSLNWMLIESLSALPA